MAEAKPAQDAAAADGTGNPNPNPMFSNSIDRLKESFLLATAQGGNAEDCEALLSIGADVNWRGQDSETPLLAACKRGHKDAMSMLLAYGADSNARGADSMTPLHIASRRGDCATVNMLLHAGVNVNVRTTDGKTAFDIARSKGFEDVCQCLISHRHNPSPSEAGQAQAQTGRPVAVSGATSQIVSGSRANNNNALLAASWGPTDGSGSGNGRPDSKASSRAEEKSSGSDSGGSERPSSKAADKRPAPLGAAAAAAAAVEGPRSPRGGHPHPVAVAPPKGLSDDSYSLSAGISGSSNSSSSSGSGGDGPLAGPYQNYIYDLQARVQALEQQLQGSASEAEVRRLQLEEALIEGMVAAKECVALKEALLHCKEQGLDAERELTVLRADDEALQEITTVAECDKVERYIKASLARYEEHKAMIINKMVEDNTEDSRLCVVCQGAEKSVVLLPCRHVCLCKDCARNDAVADCPLCRVPIQDRIAVFM